MGVPNTQSDLLVINKTDLAPLIGADLDVMARDAWKMRGDGPFVFAQVTSGIGVTEIADYLQDSWRRAAASAPSLSERRRGPAVARSAEADKDTASLAEAARRRTKAGL